MDDGNGTPIDPLTEPEMAEKRRRAASDAIFLYKDYTASAYAGIIVLGVQITCAVIWRVLASPNTDVRGWDFFAILIAAIGSYFLLLRRSDQLADRAIDKILGGAAIETEVSAIETDLLIARAGSADIKKRRSTVITFEPIDPSYLPIRARIDYDLSHDIAIGDKALFFWSGHFTDAPIFYFGEFRDVLANSDRSALLSFADQTIDLRKLLPPALLPLSNPSFTDRPPRQARRG